MFKVKKITVKKQEVSYPDIDTDLDGAHRHELIEYLVQKYGKNNVCAVGNRMEYQPRSIIHALARVHDVPVFEAAECSKEYNDLLTVRENMAFNKKIKKFFDDYPQLINKVDKLVGTLSSFGTHAGGVVITDSKYPIDIYCALQKSGGTTRSSEVTGGLATAWTKDELQALGLVKYDLLGLTEAGQNHLIKTMVGFDPYKPITIEDPEAYKDVVGGLKNRNIFQFDTELGKRVWEDLQPQTFMELTNASSILRVMGSLEGREIYSTYKQNVTEAHKGDQQFWANKLRHEVIEDRNYEACSRVLFDSYGVLIFQEQLANLIKEFSGGQKTFNDGNKVRKTLENHSKRFGSLYKLQGNADGLKKWHDGFMAVANEYLLPYLGRDGRDSEDPDIQDFLNFNLTEDYQLPTPKKGIISWFISSTAYLFSKLHAVAYTQNTYDALYMKHYYPLQFWCGSLTYEEDDLDQIAMYLAAIKAETDIKVLPPDVNKSDFGFTIEGDKIRYGLGAIQGIDQAARLIVENRKLKGNYKSIWEIRDRLGTKAFNKKTMEALIYSNALSEWGDVISVQKNFSERGIVLDNLVTDQIQLSLLETKYMGMALVNIHPYVERASRHIAAATLRDQQSEYIVVHILDVVHATTKKSKPYTMFKCQDLKDMSVINIYDWDNNAMNFKKGTFEIMYVTKNKTFLNLKMNSQVKPGLTTPMTVDKGTITDLRSIL